MLVLLQDKIDTPLGPLWIYATSSFACAPSSGTA
jgi:hypothetical protein